jgi:hypothetical protein
MNMARRAEYGYFSPLAGQVKFLRQSSSPRPQNRRQPGGWMRVETLIDLGYLAYTLLASGSSLFWFKLLSTNKIRNLVLF